MMTREEAIKIINCYDIGFYDLSGEKIPADKLADAFDMAIKALEQTRWIPVSERLPDEEEVVLVDDGYDMFIAWYSDGKWESTDSMYCSLIPIIAWMPKPYGEDGEA